MQDFHFTRPDDLAAAGQAHQASDDGAYMAGGQTLIPVLKQGLAMPEDVIDLNGIADLSGIEADGHGITIGATTRHASVAASEAVCQAIPALADLAGRIGDPQVRNRGTIGGSLANNDPSADYPAAVLALNATVVTDRREIAAEAFFDGLFTTNLNEGEIITRVRFAAPDRAAYEKFPNPASRYALVGVFVAQTADGVRVAVTGAGQDGVFRAAEMETALADSFSAGALDGIAVPADDLMTDMHAAADYRAHLITVMAKRAVARAAATA